jgi:hypothetical protein
MCPLRLRTPVWFLAGLVAVLSVSGLFPETLLQAQDHKSKVPVIDKIEGGGPTQQQFLGLINSIDLDNEVLSVDNISGKSTEIFPIKKKVHVVTADGGKMKLESLARGTKVLVYFDQKADRRTVTRIEVLAGGEKKKKAPPS